MAANRPGKPGPYSRKVSRGLLDGRTVSGRYVRHMRAELENHLGHEPTFPQRVLIEQTSIIALRLMQVAERIAEGEVLSQHDNNQAIAWHNALRRNLVELGLETANAAKSAPVDPMANLRAYLAEKDKAA